MREHEHEHEHEAWCRASRALAWVLGAGMLVWLGVMVVLVVSL